MLLPGLRSLCVCRKLSYFCMQLNTWLWNTQSCPKAHSAGTNSIITKRFFATSYYFPHLHWLLVCVQCTRGIANTVCRVLFCCSLIIIVWFDDKFYLYPWTNGPSIPCGRMCVAFTCATTMSRNDIMSQKYIVAFYINFTYVYIMILSIDISLPELFRLF